MFEQKLDDRNSRVTSKVEVRKPMHRPITDVIALIEENKTLVIENLNLRDQENKSLEKFI